MCGKACNIRFALPSAQKNELQRDLQFVNPCINNLRTIQNKEGVRYLVSTVFCSMVLTIKNEARRSITGRFQNGFTKIISETPKQQLRNLLCKPQRAKINVQKVS